MPHLGIGGYGRKMKTVTEFVKRINVPENLSRAVIRQAGGWERFKITANAIIQNENVKKCGFEYHTETAKFFIVHRDPIRKFINRIATEGGQTSLHMIVRLPSLNNDFHIDDVGYTLYGPQSKVDIQIAHALACFVLEKIVQAFIDLTEK